MLRERQLFETLILDVQSDDGPEWYRRPVEARAADVVELDAVRAALRRWGH